jgi:putative transposase
MTAHCYLDLLSELAITASHSRPRVSNDKPMSEAQFKTLRYQPDYPQCFDHYDHAMRWYNDYVEWYNHVHHHSSLEGFTPEQVFTGRYLDIARVRQAALNEAFTVTQKGSVEDAHSLNCPRKKWLLTQYLTMPTHPLLSKE